MITDPDLKLYHQPGACSRVTLTALEQCGVAYDDEVIDLQKGQQNSERFRSVNPLGKIPALVVDGETLFENGAIIEYLHLQYPDAGLFPRTDDHWEMALQLADLLSLSSFWHPSVRANRMPVRWTTGDIEPVKERGRQLLEQPMARMNSLFESQDYWFGADWSILDVYFYWNYTTAQDGDYPLEGLSGIARHRERVEAHPAFVRALEREAASMVR